MAQIKLTSANVQYHNPDLYEKARYLSESIGVNFEIALDQCIRATVKQEKQEEWCSDNDKVEGPDVVMTSELAKVVIKSEPLAENIQLEQEVSVQEEISPPEPIKPAHQSRVTNTQEHNHQDKQDENVIGHQQSNVRRSLRTRKINPVEDFEYPPKKPRKQNLSAIDDIRINKNPSHDRMLHKIDVHKYHECMNKSKFDLKVLELSKVTLRTMMDVFEYDSKAFFVIAWLTTVRLFEYDRKRSSYKEIKRIPQRLVDLRPELITSLHCDDAKLYYSYLMDGYCDVSKPAPDDDCGTPKPARGCIEITDYEGNQIGDPFTYEYAVESIQSDNNHIYVKLVKNIVYIHLKRFFQFAVYRISLEPATDEPLISIGAFAQISKSYMSTYMISATSNDIIITKHDALENTWCEHYHFNDDYRIVALFIREKRIIVHRRNTKVDWKTKIELGCLQKNQSGPRSFFRERTIKLKYSIIQVERGLKDELFMFGYNEMDDGNREYEIGHYNIKDLKPVWVRRLHDVTDNCKFLIQKNHIVIIKECQQYACFPKKTAHDKVCHYCGVTITSNDSEKHDKHPGIFRDVDIVNLGTPED